MDNLVFFPFTLAYPQISLAADLEVKTGIPAVGLTSANATGTVLNVGALGGDTVAGGAGFVYGTASAVGGNYNLGTSSDFTTNFTTGTDISITLTGLSRGTLYYYRAYATSLDASGVQQNAYGAEVSFLTGIDPPTVQTVEALSDRITLTWTEASGNETIKTMVRYSETAYPASITEGNLAFGWYSGTEVTVHGLPSEQTYYFSLWSSTTDNDNQGHSTTSESYATVMKATIAPAGGGGVLVAPTVYSDSLIINDGAEKTNSREVILTLKAGNASLMTISNDNLFLGPLEDYATTKSWTLTEGDGPKTVYVKFVSPDGVNSDIVSATIILETSILEEVVEETPEVEEETVPEEIIEEEVVEAEEAEVEAEAEVGVGEVSMVSLRAKILELQQKLIQLLNQLIQLLQNQINQLIS